MSVDTQSTRLRKFLVPLAVALAVLLVPLVALAIPGSGDFVALESPSGRDITELYNIIAKICLIITIIVEGVLLVAILRFRRRSDDEQPEQVHGNLKLELAWTLAAVLLQVYIGFVTIDVMFDVETLPETEITVEAIAYQWDWEFRYPDHGGIVHPDLVVPANTNVKLEVTSRDVIHSIFMPELGVKIDAVPGRFNYWWFNADGPINANRMTDRQIQAAPRQAYPTTRPDWWQYFTLDFLPETGQKFYVPESPTGSGQLERRVGYLGASRDDTSSPYSDYNAVEYRGMCTELCGKDHWDMYFRTVAMTRSDFNRWLEDKRTGGTGEADGAALYTSNCASCHGEDGQGQPGTYPPLAGAKYTTEEAYEREHVEIVLNGLDGEIEVLGETYDSVMQPFNKLNDAEVAAVINHERTSWGNDGDEVDEELVAEVRADLDLPPFPAGGADPVPDDELMATGKRVYQSCVSCHGDDGEGPDTVPNLAQNATVIGDVERSVQILVDGEDTEQWPGSQPPMGRAMSDRQLAGVLSYIRNSFGNEASVVQPEEVERIRNELQ
ncbi:MAG: cytochrome c oxidase subunit II [Persicimonas sp.]